MSVHDEATGLTVTDWEAEKSIGEIEAAMDALLLLDFGPIPPEIVESARRKWTASIGGGMLEEGCIRMTDTARRASIAHADYAAVETRLLAHYGVDLASGPDQTSYALITRT